MRITERQQKILLNLEDEGLKFFCPNRCSPQTEYQLQCQYCKKDKIITRCISKKEMEELKKGPGSKHYNEQAYKEFYKKIGLCE